MNTSYLSRLLILIFIVAVCTACATRPINPSITKPEGDSKLGFKDIPLVSMQDKDLVILAFSGGGTRSAAFSYGVLEALRRTQLRNAQGEQVRLLDSVDIITSVSGGSFTALAYRLYGEKLFEEYETRFLKRDIQGELIGRALNPITWPKLVSSGWNRSEMAADLYDEILFNGATFADFKNTKGPVVAPSATDITSGSRFLFSQTDFDILCSDMSSMRIARAAAASSAVPVLLSPITLNNYSGQCPSPNSEWLNYFTKTPNPSRAASRTLERVKELEGLSQEPYLHLVDGGVSDNLGLRGVLDFIYQLEALQESGADTKLNELKRIVVVVVNALSNPKTTWAESESPPSSISVLLQASGVPIDHYSGEQIDELRDTQARWRTLRQLHDVPVTCLVSSDHFHLETWAPGFKLLRHSDTNSSGV
ncbi:patatin-like phospholipase family protein [Polynucleobacter brandtiae]|uniref:Patatin-like phospholipase n=1 Tax=Polynucleobacter brandtiae TaxID=1938816 RepID=A0A2M8VPM8_9BURK|nr:patatin-like phospholipase family protein [Polynucleobacter brandtiae]PJI79144.1 patatin-like phospholipase [Polynucleobacter brandtiae]